MVEWLGPVFFFVFIGTLFLASARRSKSGATGIRKGSFLIGGRFGSLPL